MSNRINKTKQQRKSRKSAGPKGWSARAPNTSRVSMLGGYGDRYRTRLSYISHFTYTAITTTPSDQVMRGNSVFDPDFSGTGGQPNNFDDFALHYSSYRVYGSTIKAWVAMSAGQGELTVAARRSSTTIATISTLENVQSDPYVKHRTVGPSSCARGGPTLSMTVQSQKILGVPMVDTDMSALCTTNPTRGFFWHVIFNSFDFATSTTAEINVEVVYDVEFFVRIEGTIDARYERIQMLRQMKKAFDERRDDAKDSKAKELEDATGNVTSSPHRPVPDEMVICNNRSAFNRLHVNEQDKEGENGYVLPPTPTFIGPRPSSAILNRPKRPIQ